MVHSFSVSPFIDSVITFLSVKSGLDGHSAKAPGSRVLEQLGKHLTHRHKSRNVIRTLERDFLSQEKWLAQRESRAAPVAMLYRRQGFCVKQHGAGGLICTAHCAFIVHALSVTCNSTYSFMGH